MQESFDFEILLSRLLPKKPGLPIIVNMVGLILCLLAIPGVTVTCMFAGRFAALTLNLVAVGIGAFLAPPALSFRVENTEDVVALVFQGIVGFVLAFGFPARKHRNSRSIPDAQPRVTPAPASNY